MLIVNLYSSATQPAKMLVMAYAVELAKIYFMADKTAKDYFLYEDEGSKYFCQWVEENKQLDIEPYAFFTEDGSIVAKGFRIHDSEALSLELLKLT